MSRFVSRIAGFSIFRPLQIPISPSAMDGREISANHPADVRRQALAQPKPFFHAALSHPQAKIRVVPVLAGPDVPLSDWRPSITTMGIFT